MKLGSHATAYLLKKINRQIFSLNSSFVFKELDFTTPQFFLNKTFEIAHAVNIRIYITLSIVRM